MNKECLKIRLEVINRNIDIYKKNAIQEIEKEEMLRATSSLLLLRDLKEQQGLLEELIKGE